MILLFVQLIVHFSADEGQETKAEGCLEVWIHKTYFLRGGTRGFSLTDRGDI